MDDQSTARPTIYMQRCTSCGCCITVCPSGVFDRREDIVASSQPEQCGGCGECEMACPEDAVEVSFTIVWGDKDQPDPDAD